jgi:hypothetical protein
MQKPDFLQLLGALIDQDVQFIVVGGIAAVLQGATFSTFDLDVVHSRTPENVERLVLSLAALRASYRSRPEVAPTSHHLLSPGIQLLTTTHGPLDLLGAIEGGRDYDALLPYTKVLDVTLKSGVRVLTLPMLLSLKEASSEPKDQSQATILRRVIEEEFRLSERQPKAK